MPYPGVALGFLVCVGVAVGAMMYFFSHMDSESCHRNYNYNYNGRPPHNEPGWHQGGNTRPGHTSHSPPRKRRPKHKQSVQKEVTNCAICFEELTLDIMTLSCQHKYHPGCITGWFKQSQTCPVCRETAVM